MKNGTQQSPAACNGRTCRCAKPAAFKRLLVAVDDSVQAGYASVVADQLAAELGATVMLLNVFSFTYPPNVDVGYVMNVDVASIAPEVQETCMAMSRSMLERLKTRMRHTPHVETLTRQGDAAKEILNVAEAYGADLIIMGTHARSSVMRTILGSTALAVSRHASCPVMTVSRAPVGRLGEETSAARQPVGAATS
jgi:nucleotide-binding universal stress UspA family protein